MEKIRLPEGFDAEERAQRAKQNFLDGYNCCQAVMLAFADVFGVDEEMIATVASGFGGGMARMREVCGTVSAMGMAAGFMSPAIRPRNMEERTANYALVQEFAGEFRKENGSIVCKELLGLVPMRPSEPANADGSNAAGSNGQMLSGTGLVGSGNAGSGNAGVQMEPPRPSERTPEYYRKRPCPELVACSARIIAERLMRGI